MEVSKLPGSFDARDWAKEFMEKWGYRMHQVDESLMHVWFANAIMAGYDHRESELLRHGLFTRVRAWWRTRWMRELLAKKTNPPSTQQMPNGVESKKELL